MRWAAIEHRPSWWPGPLTAARDGVGVLLCGRTQEIERELAGDGRPAGVEIVEAPDLIDFHDEPAAAVRASPAHRW